MKHQIPSSKFLPDSRPDWSLMFGYSLELGCWTLGPFHPAAAPKSSPYRFPRGWVHLDTATKMSARGYSSAPATTTMYPGECYESRFGAGADVGRDRTGGVG